MHTGEHTLSRPRSGPATHRFGATGCLQARRVGYSACYLLEHCTSSLIAIGASMRMSYWLVTTLMLCVACSAVAFVGGLKYKRNWGPFSDYRATTVSASLHRKSRRAPIKVEKGKYSAPDMVAAEYRDGNIRVLFAEVSEIDIVYSLYEGRQATLPNAVFDYHDIPQLPQTGSMRLERFGYEPTNQAIFGDRSIHTLIKVYSEDVFSGSKLVRLDLQNWEVSQLGNYGLDVGCLIDEGSTFVWMYGPTIGEPANLRRYDKASGDRQSEREAYNFKGLRLPEFWNRGKKSADAPPVEPIVEE